MGQTLPIFECGIPGEIDPEKGLHALKAWTENRAGEAGFVAVNPAIMALNQSEFLAFGMLLKYRNGQTGTAYLRGSMLGLSTRSMNRTMDSLVKKGMVEKVEEARYYIPIHNRQGRLYPCFNRSFWNEIQVSLAPFFRLAVLLGYQNPCGSPLTVRDIRDGLRIRMKTALSLHKLLESCPTTRQNIGTSIRFRKGARSGVGEGDSKGITPTQQAPKQGVSREVSLQPVDPRIQANSVSVTSPLTREIQKEEETRGQPAFSLRVSFEDFGLPHQVLVVPKVYPATECLRDFQDVLPQPEIDFLQKVSSHFLPQPQFKEFDPSDVCTQVLNAYLRLKAKSAKLKVNGSFLSYFCGVLRALLFEGASLDRVSEIRRTRDLEAERRRKAEDERQIQAVLDEQEDRDFQAYFEAFKDEIPEADSISSFTFMAQLSAKAIWDEDLSRRLADWRQGRKKG